MEDDILKKNKTNDSTKYEKIEPIGIEEFSTICSVALVKYEGKFFERANFIKFNLQSEIVFFTYYMYALECFLGQTIPLMTVYKVIQIITERVVEMQFKDCIPKTDEAKSELYNSYKLCYSKLILKEIDIFEKDDIFISKNGLSAFSEMFLSEISEELNQVTNKLIICGTVTEFLTLFSPVISNVKIKEDEMIY